MRRIIFTALNLLAAGLLAAADPRPATAEEVLLFQEAMKGSSQDTEHWAYTETTIVQTNQDQPEGETVVRFDPSKPYAEQFTPLKIEGRAPSERQLRKYRKQGEERGRMLARKAEQRGSADDKEPQIVINDRKALLDFAHPRVLEAGPELTTFEVPLLAPGGGLPLGKFQIFAEVDPGRRQIKRARFHISGAFRLKLIAKIKSGDASLDFTVVNPDFPPVITRMTGVFGASFLMIPVKATFTNTRTDWQRVRAFDERFNVKLAPLQFPGF